MIEARALRTAWLTWASLNNAAASLIHALPPGRGANMRSTTAHCAPEVGGGPRAEVPAWAGEVGVEPVARPPLRQLEPPPRRLGRQDGLDAMPVLAWGAR